jgi:hypothetical protein
MRILTCFVIFVQLVAVARADMSDKSVWQQQWQDPHTGQWQPMGVVIADRQGDQVVLTPVLPTYFSPSFRLPDNNFVGQLTSAGATLRATFGKQVDHNTGAPKPHDRVGLFELRLHQQAYTGDVHLDNQLLGQTRFVPLSDARLRWELENAQKQWDLEALMELADFIRKQHEDDVRLNRQGLKRHSMTLDRTMGEIRSFEMRQQQAMQAQRVLRELIARIRLTVEAEPPIADHSIEESLWRQKWRASESDDWQTLGTVRIVHIGQQVVVQPITFTNTHRGTSLPTKPMTGTKDNNSVTFTGLFGDPQQGTEQRFEFRLLATSKVMEGTISSAQSPVSYTRFEKLDDLQSAIRECDAVVERWKLEQAVVFGTLPGLRNQVSTLTQQRQTGQLSDFGQINLNSSTNAIVAEELRGLVCAIGINGATEMKLRLKHDISKQQK